MSNVVLSAENIGKKYKIRHHGEQREYFTLRDVVTDRLLTPWRSLKARSANANGKGTGKSNGNGASKHEHSALRKSEHFWALKDVSFEIKRNEVVGITGRNGAGKSTLLKILSRVTDPTEGRVHIRGRVASLLEVGTGFHPELTGRENIYLNGAILGMTKAEIRHKFDEIVAFAEIEKFLDTPVKRFSSGMYMRLAFAIAAHLEPEILIVDEVLAVGDAEFQKKCIARMEAVTTGGNSTVLLVSHNQAMIRSLCNTAILLENGRMTVSGSSKFVCDRYQALVNENQGWINTNSNSNSPCFCEIQILDNTGGMANVFEFGQPLRIRCRARLPHGRSFIMFIIKAAGGGEVAELFDVGFNPSLNASEVQIVEAVVEKHNLLPGDYTIDAWLGEGFNEPIERLIDCCSFTVVDGCEIEITKHLALRPSGVVFLKSSWTTPIR